MNARAMDRFDAVDRDVIARRVAANTAPHAPWMADLVDSIRACAADRPALAVRDREVRGSGRTGPG